MIDVKTKIHDKFSIEFKIGFNVRRKLKENNFAINTWLFIPGSLDINSQTYNKREFYSDVKSNIRFITPTFLLKEIVGGPAIPFRHLEKAMEAVASEPLRTAVSEYEYQVKMFSAIVKSAIRDEMLHILNNKIVEDTPYIVRSYISNITNILQRYRALRKLINVPTITPNVREYYLFGDEFISNILAQYTYKLIDFLSKSKHTQYKPLVNELIELIRKENKVRQESGYIMIDPKSKSKNRELVFRHGILKRYIESDLFLNAQKKKDGALAEQFIASIAAGISMIFATVIAFTVQMKYGNFTLPLFVALVVGYMGKDRIKELMRHYFVHKLGDKYYDNKIKIFMKEQPLGVSKEGVDFITAEKTPSVVMDLRNRSPIVEAENRIVDDKILLYRKLMSIDREKMVQNSDYHIAGINDIMRLYINKLIHKTDNPEVPLLVIDDNDEISVVHGEKAYYLNIIMQLQFEEQVEYKHFRVVMTRLGISDLEEIF